DKENVGKCLEEGDDAKHLPARCCVGDHHLHLVLGGGAETHDRVGQQGKKRDGRGDDHLRSHAIAEPDHDDRRDRHFGNCLESHDVGIEDPLHCPSHPPPPTPPPPPPQPPP